MYKRCIKAIAVIMAVALFSSSISIVAYAQDVKKADDVNLSGQPVLSLLSVADNKEKATSEFKIEESDKLVAENGKLQLYLEPKTLIIKIKSKATGYIWCSGASVDKTKTMSAEWKRMSQSLLMVEYIAKNGTEKRSPLNSPKAKKPKVTYIDNGFLATVNFYEAQVTLDVIVTLDDNIIKVDIPDETIVSPKDTSLGKIMIMPFLGAAYKQTTPGYHFIPDGSGATMNFSDSRNFKSSYKQRIYGSDASVSSMDNKTTSEKVSPISKIQVPVFGSVHGEEQNAFAAVVTGGDEYCEINASPAGVIVDYSWIAPSFIYNELYFQSTGSSGGFNTAQSKQNVVNAQMEYHFLDNEQADYIGIANEYKSMLIKNNGNYKKLAPQKNVPIKLDALMAEPRKALFYKTSQIMTTVTDTYKWADQLSVLGVNNLIMSLVGFEKGGSSGHKLGKFSLEKKVGNKKEILDLSSKLDKLGGKLFLQTDFLTGYEEQVKKSALKYGMNSNPISTYEQKPLFTNKVYVNDKEMTQNALEYINKAYIKNISLDSIAAKLNSDFKRGDETLRKESLDNTKRILEQLSQSASGLMLQAPNAYAMSTVKIDAAYDMPMSNSGFTYFTNSVPFLQTVYSGYVNCFSGYQNFTTNTTQDVLKLIEYNTYPSYILTEEYSNKLAKTNMNGIYSSRFDDWKPYITDNYKMVNDILSQVSGAEIVGRDVIEDGVTVTYYDNGTAIAVNYLQKDVLINSTSILAGSAAVIGKGE